MLENQIPLPPIDMVMPPVYGTILASNFLVLALVMVWIIRETMRTGSAAPLLIMSGAALASLTECLWDVLGAVWYPQYGHTPIYRLFNISVPLWMLAAYPLYLGGLGYWIFKRLGEGMSRQQMWKFYIVAWAANAVLKVPVLQLGVYVYHGPQPFKLLGFPLWQAMGNSLMPIMIGSIVFAWRESLTGFRSLMIIPIVPTAQILALGGVGWPTWLAMNSGRGYEVTYPAAMVSLVLSLMMVDLVSVKVCRPSLARVATSPVPGPS